jgi:hypothetical protein
MGRLRGCDHEITSGKKCSIMLSQDARQNTFVSLAWRISRKTTGDDIPLNSYF